jgi:hypothetical protein
VKRSPKNKKKQPNQEPNQETGKNQAQYKDDKHLFHDHPDRLFEVLTLPSVFFGGHGFFLLFCALFFLKKRFFPVL